MKSKRLNRVLDSLMSWHTSKLLIWAFKNQKLCTQISDNESLQCNDYIFKLTRFDALFHHSHLQLCKKNSLISLKTGLILFHFRMPKRVISKICYDKSDIGAGFESIWTVIDKTLETLLIIREFCDFFPKKNKIKIYQEQSEENKRYWKI